MKSKFKPIKECDGKVKQSISKSLPSHQKGSMLKERWVTWANNVKLQTGNKIHKSF